MSYIGNKQSIALFDSYTKGQQDALLANFAGIPIGVPFGVWDHLTGVVAPSNTGAQRFVKLTAGEDGVGGFNENLVSNEVITGTGDLVVVTADISVGVLTGQTVSLLNSENRYLKSGASSGAVANDQMQNLTGNLSASGGANFIGLIVSTATPRAGNLDGVFKDGGPAATSINVQNEPFANSRKVAFDSASSPNARTGTRTDTKHSQITQYMRIA
jgi:hypothetical protein